MRRLGIIDLGSNSVRLIIIDVDERNAHHQIENIKETVRLSSSLDAQGNLGEEAMEYAVETVGLFVRFCQARKVDRILAVQRQQCATRPTAKSSSSVYRLGLALKSSPLRGGRGLPGLHRLLTPPLTNGLIADFGGAQSNCRPLKTA